MDAPAGAHAPGAPSIHAPPLEGRTARLLEGLRAAGRPVPLDELAARIVASPAGRLPGPLARRVVGAVLGRPAHALPDPLDAALLGVPAQDAAAPLERAAFAVVDLETTGLSPRRAAILEIGAVRVEGLRLTSRFETLVRPDRPVPPAITALTGIDTAMVASAPPPGEALRGLRAWLGAAPGAPFVAHNARFDEGFVRRGLARHGLGALEIPVLCTCKLARRLAPELGRFGLDRLAAGLGIRVTRRHRALGDAEATAEALLHLLERARESFGARTVADLLRLQKASPRALRATLAGPSLVGPRAR